jgi:hypothetical protein
MADSKKLEDALFNLDDYITLPQAEKSLGGRYTKPGMIKLCKKYKIGMKIGGRWYVHPDKLALLLQGKLKITG